MDKDAKSSEDKRRQQSERIAENIKEQERRREEVKFQEEWNKRIDIAREGRTAYEGDDPVAAVTNYKKILSLTARRHNITIEELHPRIFDPKSRVTEAILISAICLDLAKIVERLQGESAKRDLLLYLRLFVTFSKGMPFEVIATSTLRKYMQYTRGLKHPEAFAHAHDQLKKGRCFVATVAFGDEYAPPLATLRRFRDEVLRASPRGRAFVNFYYQHGPTAAQLIARVPGARLLVRSTIVAILPILKRSLK